MKPWATTFDLDDLAERYMMLALRVTLVGWVPVVLCVLLFGGQSVAALVAVLVWVVPAPSVVLGFGLWFVWLFIREVGLSIREVFERAGLKR